MIIRRASGRCLPELSLVVSGEREGGLDTDAGETGTSSEKAALIAPDERGVELAIPDTETISPTELAVLTDAGPRSSSVRRLRRVVDRLSGGG